MNYPKENIHEYAYYTRLIKNITIDEACQFVGGLYSDHSSCQPNDAKFIWELFDQDYAVCKREYESLFEFSEDCFESEESYKYKVIIYAVPGPRPDRPRIIFFGGVSVKTQTPQKPEVEFGYSRIYRVARKYNLIFVYRFFKSSLLWFQFFSFLNNASEKNNCLS